MGNPNFLPLGDKETFMANTGTGGIASPGAVFYNPASLAEVKKSFSLSGSSYVRYELKVTPVTLIDGEEFNYDAEGFMGIPSSVISVYPRKSWSFALSVLVPSAFKAENKVSFQAQSGNQTQVDIIQYLENDDLYLGVSGGKRVTKDFSLGFSVFGIRHTETSTTHSTLVPQAIPNSATTSNMRMTLESYHARAVFGAQHRWKYYNVGLRVFTPSLQIRSRADFFQENIESSGGTVNVTTIDESNITGSDFRFPFDVTLGQVLQWSPTFLVAFDLGYQFGDSFLKIPITSAPENRIDIEGTFRYNLGFEWKITDKYHYYGGAYYNPSTRSDDPNDDSTRTVYYGGTTGLMYHSEKQVTGLGIYAASSDGRNYLATFNRNSTSRFIIVGIMITSAFKF